MKTSTNFKLFLVASIICFVALVDCARLAYGAEVVVDPAVAAALQPPADAVVVHNSGEAVGALLHFSGFSASTIGVILLLIKAGAGYWRNFAQRNKAAGEVTAFGRLVAHVAGRSLPDVAPETAPVPMQVTGVGTVPPKQ